MKILITGAGGMLGTDLAAALHPHFQVLGIGRNPAPHLHIAFQQVDLTDAAAFEAAAKKFSPDIIFHSAAMTNVDGCEQNPKEAMLFNAEATRTIAEICEKTKGFLIFFSTDYVFDGSKKGEYREDDPIHPLNHYGESKAEAERVIQKSKARYAIFRVAWLYGLHGKSFPKTILERARQQQAFEVVSDQIGRPTSTKDLANAFNHLLLRPQMLDKMNHQIFHLANTGQCSWAELAAFLLTNGGHENAVVTPITSEKLTRPAKRPKNSVLCLDKVKKELGLELRPWQDAVLEFIREFVMIPRSKG